MPSSSSKSATGGGRKRDRGRNPIPRARKKQKRLDAIRDNPLPPPPPPPSPPRLDYDEESASLRRSSRPRRVPEVLDSSPIPSFRRKNPNPPDSSKGKRTSKGKEKVRSPLPPQEKPLRDWRLRQRPTAQKAGKGSRKGKEPMKAAETGEKDSSLLVSSVGEDGGKEEAGKELEDSEQKVENSEGTEKIDGNVNESEQMLKDNDMESERILNDNELMPPTAEDSGPEKVKENLDGNAVESEQIPVEDGLMLPVEKELEDVLIPTVEKELEAPEQKVEPFQEKENLDGDAAEELMLTVEKKLEAPEQKVEEDKVLNSRGKEGRRCGLCGGGIDGKPPKKLVRESADSDDEAYAGSSASEEPNYDVWDGFGDEPGWLGKLLGPIRARFGIARLWVHQHCAVWSPEVKCLALCSLLFV